MPGGFDYSRFDKLDVSDSDEEANCGVSGGRPTKPEEVLAELPPDLPEDLSLVLAAREGQHNLVEALLDKRASVNAADPHGGTALLRAVEGGIPNRSVIELLLHRRADLQAKSSLGDCPMSVAAAKGPVPLCEALLDAGAPSAEVRAVALVAAAEAHNEATSMLLLETTKAPATARGSDGRTALHHWAAKGHQRLVDGLLAARADASACDINGVTPLICASSGGNTTVIELLCRSGAVVDQAATDGTTALVKAVGTGEEQRAEKLVKTLLEQRASVEAVSGGRSPSALVIAASTGRRSLVALLLQAGATINAADGMGRRALPCAAAGSTLELCEFLLENRAQVDARSTSGHLPESADSTPASVGVTALSIAAANSKSRLVELLLSAAADPECLDEREQTPLMVAATKGNAQICSMLLAARALPNARQNSSGKNPLLLAASAGHEEVSKVLLNANADPGMYAISGAGPLHAASANGHENVCCLLLSARASVSDAGPGGQDPVAIAKAAGNTSLVEVLRSWTNEQ